VRVISGSPSSATTRGDVAALVDRARHNDGAAFRELFQAHVVGVHRIVYRLVGQVPDLDDLVQTVFVCMDAKDCCGGRCNAGADGISRVSVRPTAVG
jgi:hypothetical protein